MSIKPEELEAIATIDHERLARVESMLAFFLRSMNFQIDSPIIGSSTGKPSKISVNGYQVWSQEWNAFKKSQDEQRSKDNEKSDSVKGPAENIKPAPGA